MYSMLLTFGMSDVFLTQFGSGKVTIAPESKVSGTYGAAAAKSQTIILTWPVPTENNLTVSTLNNVVTFTFSKNATDGSLDGIDGYFYISQIKAVLHTNPVEFPEALEPGMSCH